MYLLNEKTEIKGNEKMEMKMKMKKIKTKAKSKVGLGPKLN